MSKTFQLVYRIRMKIERLISLMKERFRFGVIYRRGKRNVEAHIDKFFFVLHLKGLYQRLLWDLKTPETEREKGGEEGEVCFTTEFLNDSCLLRGFLKGSDQRFLKR